MYVCGVPLSVAISFQSTRSLGVENFGSSFPNVDGINMDKPSDNDHAIESTGGLTIVIVFVAFLQGPITLGGKLL